MVSNGHVPSGFGQDKHSVVYRIDGKPVNPVTVEELLRRHLQTITKQGPRIKTREPEPYPVFTRAGVYIAYNDGTEVTSPLMTFDEYRGRCNARRF